MSIYLLRDDEYVVYLLKKDSLNLGILKLLILQGQSRGVKVKKIFHLRKLYYFLYYAHKSNILIK